MRHQCLRRRLADAAQQYKAAVTSKSSAAAVGVGAGSVVEVKSESPDIIFWMPVLDSHIVDFFSRSPEQTRLMGMRVGGALQPGDVVCLQGDLGAGKTTFVQGVAEGWGSVDEVSSPTFIIVNQYRDGNDRQLFHMDAYRLDSAQEAEEIDIDAMLARGPLLIEWPERMERLIPRERLWVQLETMNEDERQMKFKSHGKRYDNLLETIRRAAYGAD